MKLTNRRRRLRHAISTPDRENRAFLRMLAGTRWNAEQRRILRARRPVHHRVAPSGSIKPPRSSAPSALTPPTPTASS